MELLGSFAGDDKEKSDGIKSLSDYIPNKYGKNALKVIGNIAKDHFEFSSKIERTVKEELSNQQKA